MTIIMVIIIFYSRIVPYKWLEDGAEADHPNEVPALLPVQRNVLFSSCSFSFVKKMLARREGELWEERVGYIRSAKCLYPPV